MEVMLHQAKFKNKKDAQSAIGDIKNNSKLVNITLEDLLVALERGQTVTPGVCGAKAASWERQQLFMVDVDNSKKDEPILKGADALRICKKHSIPLAFIYPTFNHTSAYPKFRLGFIMDKPVTDNKQRENIINALVNMFPQSDKSCRNADRIFFGTNKKVVVKDLKKRITYDDILAINPPPPFEKLPMGAGDHELVKMKAGFDLASHMIQRNGKHTNCGNYIKFETCEICGHNDDLRYYHRTNSWFCYGANGRKGGSIIDYFMHSEGLSQDEAIDKLYKHFGKKRPKKEAKGDLDLPVPKLQTISALELQKKEMADVKWIVKDMLPQGLAALVAPPKYFKSYMAFDLCLAVARGRKFLMHETNKATCCYIALEDSENRLKKRQQQILQDEDAPENLILITKAQPLHEGLISQLESLKETATGLQLVVIDTLQKIRGNASYGQGAYNHDYQDMSLLKSFADKHAICVMVIHHLRKGKDDSDPFNNISGTNGIFGALDTCIVLQKENRTDKETTFHLTGRDVESAEFLMEFDTDFFAWKVTGSAEEKKEKQTFEAYNKNVIVQTIKLLLEEHKPFWVGSSTDLITECTKRLNQYPGDNANIISRKINNEWARQLYQYDGIMHTPPNANGGAGGRKHKFEYLMGGLFAK